MNWKNHKNTWTLKYGFATVEIKELMSCFQIVICYWSGAKDVYCAYIYKDEGATLEKSKELAKKVLTDLAKEFQELVNLG
jgi:hypothetical protein